MIVVTRWHCEREVLSRQWRMILMMNSSLSFEYWKMECSLSRDVLFGPGRHFSLDGHFQARLSTSADSCSSVGSPHPLQRGLTEQRKPASMSQLTRALGSTSSLSSTASRLTSENLGLLQSFLTFSSLTGMSFLFTPDTLGSGGSFLSSGLSLSVGPELSPGSGLPSSSL